MIDKAFINYGKENENEIALTAIPTVVRPLPLLPTGRNERVGNWAGVTVDKKKRLLAKVYDCRRLIVRSSWCLFHVPFYRRRKYYQRLQRMKILM